MRRSLRFLSSCSSSSLIFIGGAFRFIQQKVFARHTAQDHAFEPVHVVEAIAGSFVNGGDYRVTGIVADHAQQLAQDKDEGLASVLLERGEIAGQFGGGLKDRLMFRRRGAALDTFTT